MPNVNYYPFHIGDYVRETAHLSMLEDAAYRRLLDLYYTTEKPFSQPVDKLCELVRAKSSAEKRAVEKVLATFFVFGEGSELRHKRCDAEIAKAKEKSNKASTSAGKRWHSRGNANALPTHSEGNAPNTQEPIPIPKEDLSANGAQGEPATPAAWWKTEDGIRAKGQELGVGARRGESWHQYKDRLFKHMNGEKAA
jgi:uncharacterized protein YdaU (DUF1376 family)